MKNWGKLILRSWRIIFKEGGDINAIGKNDLTIICEAIRWNNLPLINACIDQGASLSHTLQMATHNGLINLIRPLVNAGADVNERNHHGETPIKYVLGTMLADPDGARNRAIRDLLLELGAEED